ncbi:hypothetical protein [Oryzibacter oryziterrae]|uniref:hypothetical protein n=1 Tax=Oryzibacter oryziterrae TaxID=2766474 RepID=UPI001F3EDC14|nr:hypothetical protein [Oryzibacter oryziterrae]
MKPAKVLIATPTAYGDLCAEYCEAIFDLKASFAKRYPQVTFEVRFFETFDLRLVRNAYASIVLNDPSFTHLFFFDSDMGFFPSLMEKMLLADKPVVGVVSPKRALDTGEVYNMARQFNDIRIAEIAANGYIPEKTAYTVAYAEDGVTPIRIKYDGSLLPVNRCGTGIMLIHRSVFETFRDKIPEDYYEEAPEAVHPYGVTRGYLGCFDAVALSTGATLGEDFAFSRRWSIRLGNPIHLVFDEVIFHVGDRNTIGNAAIRYGNSRRR